MYEGGDSIFCGHNILNPFLLTIETNKGQFLTTIIYSEPPTFDFKDVWGMVFDISLQYFEPLPSNQGKQQGVNVS
jgi:hypothetical protein